MSETTEPLTFIVYASRARGAFGHAQLVELLTQSRERNARDHVTGMLVYRDQDFIQMLEGPDHAVRGLLDRIAADDRHTDVRVLLDETVAERRFATWSMGYEPTPSDGQRPGPTIDALSTAVDESARRESADQLGGWFRDTARADSPQG